MRFGPRALLLTAGRGTRLRPLTDIRAKPAVPVNGEPLVRRILRWLGSEGVSDVVLNLHHRPETIAAVVGDGSDLGAHVRYSWEQPILGSAGGPRHALPLLGDQPFLLINGDTLTDINLVQLVDAHGRSGAAVTMALIPNPSPDRYGGVQLSDSGHVTGFTRPGTAGASFHFVGVQVANAAAFAALDDGKPAESVNALYPQLIAQDPRAVAGVVCDARFIDIGTPRDYLDAARTLAATEGDRLAAGNGTTISPTAAIVHSALWDDVTVGAGARLTDCIVADGVVIPPGATYHGRAIVRSTGRVTAGDEEVVGDLLIRRI